MRTFDSQVHCTKISKFPFRTHQTSSHKSNRLIDAREQQQQQQSIMDRRNKHSLRILEPELPTVPCLPIALNRDDNLNDSDSSCISAYYIPGITGKARCLADKSKKTTHHHHRKPKTSSARALYVPSSSGDGHESETSHVSLPLLDVYTSDQIDDTSTFARSLPDDLSLDDLTIASVIPPEGRNSSIVRTKVQLETQLGSIRGLLEEHSSRNGVKTFKELQEKRRTRKKLRAKQQLAK